MTPYRNALILEACRAFMEATLDYRACVALAEELAATRGLPKLADMIGGPEPKLEEECGIPDAVVASVAARELCSLALIGPGGPDGDRKVGAIAFGHVFALDPHDEAILVDLASVVVFQAVKATEGACV